MDLRDALNVQRKLRDRGDKKTKIGIVVKNVTGMAGDCPVGTVVLFRKEDGFGDLTIELPMTHLEILERTSERTSKGSRNITKCTMVGVPSKYIEEIIFE